MLKVQSMMLHLKNKKRKTTTSQNRTPKMTILMKKLRLVSGSKEQGFLLRSMESTTRREIISQEL